MGQKYTGATLYNSTVSTLMPTPSRSTRNSRAAPVSTSAAKVSCSMAVRIRRPPLSRPATPHPSGIAQSRNLATRMVIGFHQAVDNCGGRFTIMANYAQGVRLMQGAERRHLIDEAPTLRELKREVVANQLQLMCRGDGLFPAG